MKQHRMEQVQLSHLIERFPHYVMLVRAEDLTVQKLSPGYQQLLGNRNAAGLPVSDIFSGTDVDQFMTLLRKAVRETQTVQSDKINAFVGGDNDSDRLAHTIVPILDESGTTVDRLFIYSDKPGGR